MLPMTVAEHGAVGPMEPQTGGTRPAVSWGSVRAVREEHLVAVPEQEKGVVRHQGLQLGLLRRERHEKDAPAAVAPELPERLVIEKEGRCIRIVGTVF